MMEGIIIVVLLSFMFIQEHQNRKERKRLIEAFLAKNLNDLKQGELIEKVKPNKEKAVEPEWEPVENASREDFMKAIKKELGREGTAEKIREAFKRVTKN